MIVNYIFLALAVIILDLIIAMFICSRHKNLTQIGSTCGFYALAFVTKKMKRYYPKYTKKVREDYVQDVLMLKEQNKTYVGEMFQIDKLVAYANERYKKSMQFKDMPFNTEEEIQDLLQSYPYVIFPIQRSCPHYVILKRCSNKNKARVYNNGVHIKLHLNALLEQNEDIKNIYDWNDWIDESLSLKILYFFMYKRKDRINRKRLNFLTEEQCEYLKSHPSEVTMSNQCIVAIPNK